MMSLLVLFPSSANAAGKTKLNSTKKTINVGDSCTVKLLNNKKKVKWSTSNKNIRIVSKSNKQAKIKGVKKGTSYLKAKVGSKTYKCKVTVKKVNVLWIDAESEISLEEGKKKKIKTSIYPKNATDKKISWVSSNKSVATVDKKGVVKANKVGITKITARVDGHSASCNVKVYKNLNKRLYQDENIIIDMESISFSDYPDEYRINLAIENIGDEKIEMYMEDTSVNGYMVEPIFVSEIMTNKKIKDNISIFAEEVNGGEIREMETRFRIYLGSYSFDNCYETDIIKITFE